MAVHDLSLFITYVFSFDITYFNECFPTLSYLQITNYLAFIVLLLIYISFVLYIDAISQDNSKQ